MCTSGLRISTPAGRSMSLAVISPGPVTTSGASTSVASECIRQTMPLRLRTMSVTSSLTPLIVENSWATPSMRTLVTAAPASELQQHAAQRVAERVAEAAVERLDRERAAVLLDGLAGDPGDWKSSIEGPVVVVFGRRARRAARRAAGGGKLGTTWSTARR